MTCRPVLPFILMAAACLAGPASAAPDHFWDLDDYYGRDVVSFRPEALRKVEPRPQVMVFDQADSDAGRVARQLPLWRHAIEGEYEVIYYADRRSDASREPDREHLMKLITDLVVTEGSVKPEQLVLVAYGDDAKRAVRLACDGDQMFAAIIAIDHPPFTADCRATGSNVHFLSIRDEAEEGKERAYSTLLAALQAAGMTTDELVIPTSVADAPDIAARHFWAFGVGLDDLVSASVLQTIRKHDRPAP